MARVIAIANHKGGVGKTTTSVSIGSCLAELGKKVLLVDADAQANTSEHLGQREPEFTLYHAIRGDIKYLPIVEYDQNLHLVPTDIDMIGADIELLQLPVNREIVIRNLLLPYQDKYDFIIIDCPPNVGQMTINALVAANDVIVPIEAEKFSEKGLERLTEIMALIQPNLNQGIKLTGILLCKFVPSQKLHDALHKRVRAKFPGLVFDTPIRRNVALSEAAEVGKHIAEYASDSNGADDYRKVVKELLER